MPVKTEHNPDSGADFAARADAGFAADAGFTADAAGHDAPENRLLAREARGRLIKLSRLELGPRRLAQAEMIVRLAAELEVDVLAHFYQRREVRTLASYCGGSAGLYEAAKKSRASALLLCGVDFLGERVARIRPDLPVVIPRRDAGCPFSKLVGPGEVAGLRLAHPEKILAADLKASGDILGLCDLAVGSARDLPAPGAGGSGGAPLLVLPALSAGDPDRLAHGQFPGAVCHVHRLVRLEDVLAARASRPGAKIVVNSLCAPEVRKAADFVGDSQSIFDWCSAAPPGEFVVACESGLVETLQERCPQSRFLETETEVFCPNMKLTNLKDILAALEAHALGARKGPGQIDRACAEARS
ncbi:MAG: quinolinate synthase NadA [Deltaproteobacteria bacterium]|jgi:quinolinate synthase|nr:quinolinate synthase NadA [Deltaproteobacteria bacterium]